jgi:hypothetical protein
MAGKGRISGWFLTSVALACITLSACVEGAIRTEVEFGFTKTEMTASKGAITKAAIPDEELISGYTLMVFDSHGNLEFQHYSESPQNCTASLLKGEKYSIYACINFGYDIKVKHLNELKDIYFHLAYPDEYKGGIPMAAHREIVATEHLKEVILEPVRLMSKISIKMDRSRLSEKVNMDVSAIRIGNCPKKVKVFDTSRTISEDDCFTNGFEYTGLGCTPLNTENSSRTSGNISLYMLENMQGLFSETDIVTDSEKVFAEYDSRSKICSYIEMELDYISDEWASRELPLIYRFYLGEDRNSLNIERNCHYHVTICPEDDGLKGEGWRVDKTGLKYTGETSFQPYPADYIVGNIGDKIHIGCQFTPSHAPFDVGEEYMADDKAEGIYDYKIDEDGHGATLTLTGPGRGLIYMEAGDPINEAALFIIEVNLPK